MSEESGTAAAVDPGDIRVTVRGDVPAEAADDARAKVAHLFEHVAEPVLFAEVELEHAADPARERPAMVEVTLDLDGRLVRAHVAAHEMTEAIDLVVDRLTRRVRRDEERRHRAGRELHRTGEHADHEWHHGDLPEHRPEHLPLPYEEKEVVRTRSFAPDPMTVDEAAFDLDRLGHDFSLFRELTTGAAAVISFDGERGGLRLQVPEGTAGDPVAGAAVPVTVVPPAPVLDERDAIERLESGGEAHVFFTDAATGRASVAYHRYDGNWGLLTLP